MRSVRFENGALENYASKSQWDASAGDLVASMLDRWHLVAGAPYVGGESAAVLRVTTSDGRPAVLKVGFPHSDGRWEAVALEWWGTEFAPEVIRQDAWTWAMLLERVEPGSALSRHPVRAEHALEIAATLFSRAVVQRSPLTPPSDIPRLSEVVGRYVMDATTRLPRQHKALERWGGSHALESGLGDALELAAGDRSTVLLHGDLNPGNIIQRGRQWALIDPKPMLGEPEFELFPLIEQLGSPLTQPRAAHLLARHLDLVAGLVGCDPARAARWCVARAALNVSWHLDDGNEAATHSGMRELGLWRDVSGF